VHGAEWFGTVWKVLVGGGGLILLFWGFIGLYVIGIRLFKKNKYIDFRPRFFLFLLGTKHLENNALFMRLSTQNKILCAMNLILGCADR
jgi:hypothetical protein